MGRPTGVKNQDYDEKRDALLTSLVAYVQTKDVSLPSLRQMAIHAGVSDVTLRHYFGDRTGLIIAIIRRIHDDTENLRAAMRQPADTVSEAVEDYVSLAYSASQNDAYFRSHVFAIREAMLEPAVFDAYNKWLFEPGVEALAERLIKSVGGPSNFPSARHAAEIIISSAMVLALRHQMSSGCDGQGEISKGLSRIQQWMLNGILRDPNGLGKQAAA